MSNYISREAFIADCEGRYCAPCKEQGKDSNGMKCRACWVDDMLGEVMNAPAADVEPVRYGRWIDNGIPESVLSGCSICGYSCGAYTFNYCPNCGAKMDLEVENDG